MAWKNASILRAIPAWRPVSAPVERPPGPQVTLPRRDIARRARPFRARGAVCRGRASPILSPLKCSLHRRCKRHFRGIFHLVFPQDSATKWSRRQIAGIRPPSRNFPHTGLRRTAPTATFIPLISVFAVLRFGPPESAGIPGPSPPASGLRNNGGDIGGGLKKPSVFSP